MRNRPKTLRRSVISPQITLSNPQREAKSLPKVYTRSKSPNQSITPLNKSGSIRHSDNFNKYYIHPELRYKSKQQNPKNNLYNYEDDTFIYRNLHNLNFWNWVHPLDDYSLKRPANLNTISAKVNKTVLQKFNHYIKNRSGRRLPLTVQQILSQQI